MAKSVNSGEKTDGKQTQESGLVAWLYNVFFSGNDPEREKRRLLKSIAKDFSKVRYKFYRPKGNQALPALAKFFYECYKVSANAAVILQNSDKSNTLKTLCIEHFLTPQQLTLLDHFGEDYIRERSRTTEPKVLAGELKDDLVAFFSSFDSHRIGKINETYANLVHFLKFITFDFYFVLKKFDSSLKERNFSVNPKFEVINSEYIIDDIKDFQEIAFTLGKNDEWGDVFDVLRKYKSIDPVDRSEWNKIVNLISQVNNSDILTLIVQHASGDPWYKPAADRQVGKVVEPYIEKMRTQVESIIQKIAGEKRNAHIDKLALLIFGTKDIQRTKYYNEKSNQAFSRKQTQGYIHTAALNYMKAFLLDYFKKDVREIQEFILVRGKWTTNVMSQQLSDIYYQVLSISDQLIAFDESLSEDGENGSKIRKALGRVVDRDTSSGNSLRQIINEMNDKALRFVIDCSQALITFGKYLKTILEDYDKVDHEVLINWKELESYSETPLKSRISEVYKKLYYLIQLMQIFAKPSAAPAPAQAKPNPEDIAEEAI